MNAPIVGRFLSPFDRAARIGGQPIPPRAIALWADEQARGLRTGAHREARSAGLCSRLCGEEAERGHATCAGCREERRVKKAAKRTEARAEGRCSRCYRRSVRPGLRTCSTCAEARQTEKKRRRARRNQTIAGTGPALS